MALDPIQAQALKDKGLISEEAYNQFVPQPILTEPTPEQVAALPSDISDKAKLQAQLDAGNANIGRFIPEGGQLRKKLNPTEGERAVASQAVADQEAADAAAIDTAQIDSGVAPQTQSAPKGNAPQGSGAYGTLMKSFADQQAAINEGAKVGMEQASAEAAYQDTMNKDLERQAAEAQAKELNRQAELDKKLEVLNQKQEQFAAKPATVAEKFANADTGNKIMMAVSLFLGAAPDGTAQNKALSVLQASIDSDLAKAKADIGNANTIYSEMKATFKDQREAEAATRMTMLNNAQLKLNQIASQYKSPQLAANAKLMNAKLNEEKGKIMDVFSQRVNNKTDLSGADPVTQKILKLPQAMQAELFKAKESYDATQSAYKTFDDAFKAGAELGLGTKIPLSDAKTKLATLNAQIESAVRETLRGQGTLQETEIKRLIEPFQMGAYDRDSQRAIKLKGLKSFIEGKTAGPQSRLTSLGILPKPLSQRVKTLKPN